MHHRTPILILILLVWLLAACDPLAISTPTPSPAPPTPTTEPTFTPEPEPEATPTFAPLPPTPTTEAALPTTTTEAAAPTATGQAGSLDAGTQREINEIESQTSELRGLQPKEDVPEKIVPQAQLIANLSEEIDKDYKPEEARQDVTALWLMRLLKDPSIDIRQLQKDLLGEQVLGYYDHKKNELFVRSDEQGLSPLARETLAHEFTHSLQDQYYDLDKLRPDDIDNDRGTAVLSLIEGDATFSGIGYARQYMSPSDFQALINESDSSSKKVLEAAPLYVRESLLFPYDQSIELITALLRQHPGSFKGIDDAFKDPPQSSEQILHPEKYLDSPRDLPKSVTLPPLTTTLGAGWTQRDTDTIGEFDLGVILRDNDVATPIAEEAAAGWGGGRYALYQKGDAALVILGTLWDTGRDAAEFNNVMRISLASLKKDGELWTDGKRFFALKHAADNITFVGGTDRSAVQRAIEAK